MDRLPPAIERLTMARAPLGRWYGDPVGAQAAQALVELIARRTDSRRRRGIDCISGQLLRLIGCHWQGGNIRGDYEQLALHFRLRHSRRALAMLELITGQLLMSSQHTTAIGHLQRGFELARPLFAPADYFTVLNRHQLLVQLPTGAGSPPQPLAELLTTAAVMARFDDPHRRRRPFRSDPTDLYG